MFTNLLTSSVLLIAFPPTFWLYYNFCFSQNVSIAWRIGYWRILRSTSFSLTQENGLLDIFCLLYTECIILNSLEKTAKKKILSDSNKPKWREHHLFPASFAMDMWLSVQPDGLTSHWKYSKNNNEDEDECCCAADARAVSRAPITCARSDAGRETWR